MKKRKCTICVPKTKALISFAVTAKLICVFVFAYANCWFSHGVSHFMNITRSSLLTVCSKFTLFLQETSGVVKWFNLGMSTNI